MLPLKNVVFFHRSELLSPFLLSLLLVLVSSLLSCIDNEPKKLYKAYKYF